MINTFSIVPYTSVGPLRFGMTPEEVEVHLGPAESVSTTRMRKERQEYRGDIAARYSSNDGTLTELSFLPGVEVWYKDVDILNDSDTIANLSRFDRDLYECAGFLVFLGIGIMLTGYRETDDKSVSVFSKGRLDDQRSHFVKYHG